MKAKLVLRLLGMILLVAGSIIGVAYFSNALYRSLALFACILGLVLIRSGAKYGSRMAHGAKDSESYGSLLQGPGWLAWSVAAASLLAMIGFGIALYFDALHGYHWYWPLYAFFASVLFAMPAWGYIFAKLRIRIS